MLHLSDCQPTETTESSIVQYQVSPCVDELIALSLVQQIRPSVTVNSQRLLYYCNARLPELLFTPIDLLNPI